MQLAILTVDPGWLVSWQLWPPLFRQAGRGVGVDVDRSSQLNQGDVVLQSLLIVVRMHDDLSNFNFVPATNFIGIGKLILHDVCCGCQIVDT
jgi:hypothetical protein